MWTDLLQKEKPWWALGVVGIYFKGPGKQASEMIIIFILFFLFFLVWHILRASEWNWCLFTFFIVLGRFSLFRKMLWSAYQNKKLAANWRRWLVQSAAGRNIDRASELWQFQNGGWTGQVSACEWNNSHRRIWVKVLWFLPSLPRLCCGNLWQQRKLNHSFGVLLIPTLLWFFLRAKKGNDRVFFQVLFLVSMLPFLAWCPKMHVCCWKSCL